MPTIRIQTEDFNLHDELTLMRTREGGARIGAVASFVGLVRDVNDGSGVSTLTLEHYPGMTEKALGAIVVEAEKRWKTKLHRAR